MDGATNRALRELTAAIDRLEAERGEDGWFGPGQLFEDCSVNGRGFERIPEAEELYARAVSPANLRLLLAALGVVRAEEPDALPVVNAYDLNNYFDKGVVVGVPLGAARERGFVPRDPRS